MNIREKEKLLAAQKAVEYVHSGQIVGIGTGTTVYYVIQELAKKVHNGLNIVTVASSVNTEKLLNTAKIQVLPYTGQILDIYIDGADEVDPTLTMIKGGGGALVREKILAYNSEFKIIVVDHTKIRDYLGAYPLPIEIVPFSYPYILRVLKSKKIPCKLRKKASTIHVTDNKNYIIDCEFHRIEDPVKLYNELKYLPGVVEVGLFIDYIDLLIIGRGDRAIEVTGTL